MKRQKSERPTLEATMGDGRPNNQQTPGSRGLEHRRREKFGYPGRWERKKWWKSDKKRRTGKSTLAQKAPEAH
ncbi:hypothetical protein SLA2020_243530 [Shorea laevis]